MPMDEYDMHHESKFEDILDIYRNSNITELINNFIDPKNISHAKYTKDEIHNKINSTRNT